ncbi:hydrogenase formation protein HypD [bacterium]|nr:hydrogenase formation protein HypD [bacterium]
MNVFDQWRNAAVAKPLAESIRSIAGERPIRIMEVCGGHTAAIYRFALQRMLPGTIQFLHGPGCPVCVTGTDFIDRAIAIARAEKTTVASFGDLIRVPGSTLSLAEARAAGSSVEVFYSAMDALEWAVHHPDRTVVFLAIGFETTACTIAAALSEAVRRQVKNFRILSAMKTMPGALHALLSDSRTNVDALILPGHVCSVIGSQPFEFIAHELRIPCVVSGFEPLDILESVRMLSCQLVEHRCEVEIQYRRAVKPSGNVAAQQIMEQMFEPVDMTWRGLGSIPASGLGVRREYSAWDAASLAGKTAPSKEPPGCRCGDVLRGSIRPEECSLFRKACTPDRPRGACMVSSEGACAAVYQFAGAEDEH